MVAKSPAGVKSAAEIKAYWITGEGRSKWHTWTELYHHLLKYIHDPEFAKRTTERWYFEATGMHGGSDANRVSHGKPPRGKKIGPG
jgi:hypothetical protein